MFLNNSFFALFFVLFVSPGFQAPALADCNDEAHNKVLRPEKNSTLSFAEAIAQQADPELRVVLQEFHEISKIYRNSGEEGLIREHLISIAKSVGASYHVDVSGNLTVSLPGTGQYQNLKLAIGLQGHVDMVQDVRGLLPGESSTDYFKKPLDLVVTDGILHSRNHTTSIGADNGAGVAMMIRYLRDPTIAHPPLELYFTVDEERGLVGAAGLKLSSNLQALINVDSEDFGSLSIGCLGSARMRAAYEFAAETELPIPGHTRVFKINLSGLDGGHSGLQIHLGRGNAAKATAVLLQKLEQAKISTTILSLVSGDVSPEIYNKIPKFSELQIAVSPADEQKLNSILKKYGTALKKKYSGEKVEFKYESAKVGASLPGVSLDAVYPVVKQLVNLPDGVITRNENFTNGMDLSSNVSFLEVKQKENGGASMKVGVMPRAFTNPALQGFVQQTEKALTSTGIPADFSISSASTPWTPQPKSHLVTLATERFKQSFPNQFFEITAAPGGLEPARFAAQNPNLPMISLGPTITNPHTAYETLDLESTQKTIQYLDALLLDLGKSQ